jgi:uncharacterized OB-fold protein
MSGIVIGACAVCGRHCFPKPIWCANCGSGRIRDAVVHSGVVEETTTVHHAAGRDLPEPITVGSVRVLGDAVVIARLEPGVDKGAPVELDADDGPPVARRVGR